MNPTRSKFTVLKQICNLIPAHLVPKLAHKHGVDKQARTFSPWSHVVAMLHCQLAHSLSLNVLATRSEIIQAHSPQYVERNCRHSCFRRVE